MLRSMHKQPWTIVVVPPGAGETKSLRISLTWLRVAFGGAIVFAIASVIVGYSAVSKAVALSYLDRLERRNELLSEELDQAARDMAMVRELINSVQDRDATMRRMAGLLPADPDVRQAGIGGPIGEWTESELRLAEGAAGQAALELRTDIATLVRRANMLEGSYDAIEGVLRPRIRRLNSTPSITPTDGMPISHFMAQRMHPIHHVELPHEGIDIVADVGAPVIAPADGTIERIHVNGGYGLMLTINHGNGLKTRYAHLSKADFFRPGDRVSRGDKIAEVGESGVVTGPHLHYEVLLYGVPKDPRNYILPRVIVD